MSLLPVQNCGLLISVFLLTYVSGGSQRFFIIDIFVHSYLNPTGQCIDCGPGPGPGCCDVTTDIGQIACPNTSICDTIIGLCSRPVGAEDLCTPTRFLGNGFFSDSNSIDLNSGLTVGGFGPWDGRELVLRTSDCSIDPQGLCGPSTLIDVVIVTIDVPVGTSSPEQTYTGENNIAQFNVSFTVRCSEEQHGADCGTRCPDFESCEGCGLSGFTGEFCQFPTETCSEVYCNGNGVCVDGNSTCDCHPGYTGDLCDIDINECEGEDCSGNGRCEDGVNSFACTCDPGYTGDTCEEEVIVDTTSTENQGTIAANTGAIAGGVVGAIIGLLLLAVIVVLVIIILKRQIINIGGRSTGDNVVCGTPAEEKIEMTQNQLYGVRPTDDDTTMEADVVYWEIAEEKIEMTQNQLYGVRPTDDEITVEANVVYGVTNEPPPEDDYEQV